ncbi:isocitrate lyase/phosphoenolpyruvate mutase family protein [Streptomyces sp. NBC_00564]|nr:isocitrate lyase/phosphoenolpyruvate mutase family protein [Streptomyces sp. NBC_00564]
MGSARVLESAGFPAVATTSAGIAFSLGRPDHDFFDEKAPDGRVDRETMMRRVREIADGVTVPVSADLEDGYGEAPETVATTVSLTLAAAPPAATSKTSPATAPGRCTTRRSRWTASGPPGPPSWNTSLRPLPSGWATEGNPLRRARTSRGTRGRRKP